MKKIWPVVVLAVVVVGLLGTMAAILGPNFFKYRYKSKQAEAKHLLRVLLTKEQEHRAARGVWATSARDLVEFMVSGPRSCTCFIGEKGWTERGKALSIDQLPPDVKAKIRANDPANGDDFTIACAVNLDDDADLDTWIISLKDPTPRIAFADLGE